MGIGGTVVVSPQALLAAQAALDLHDPAVPVARLRFDSLLDDVDPHVCWPRRLVFEGSGTRVQVLVDDNDAEQPVLAVGITPALSVEIVIMQPERRQLAATNRLGRAVLVLPSGLTSLLLRREALDGGPVRTAWVRI